MEITDRTDLGGGLRAPKVGTDGKPVWHYEMVSHTKPGDIVFHWHRGLGRPGIVGWSKVVGPLQETLDMWTPHAGSGAINGPEVSQPNWLMPLGGLHLLDRPITGDEIVDMRGEVLAVLQEAQDSIAGGLLRHHLTQKGIGATNFVGAGIFHDTEITQRSCGWMH